MAYFGFRITHLPDFLRDHNLLEVQPHMRLAEHCTRWTHLVSGLWRERGVAFALIYWWVPSTGPSAQGDGSRPTLLWGTTNVFLVGRAASDAELAATRQYAELALESAGISPSAMDEVELAAVLDFNAVYRFEVRQQEARYSVESDEILARYGGSLTARDHSTVTAGIYGILPWWGPGGTFSTPFSVLSSQPTEVRLIALIEPCHSNDVLPATSWLETWTRRLEKWADDSGSPTESLAVTNGRSSSRSEGRSTSEGGSSGSSEGVSNHQSGRSESSSSSKTWGSSTSTGSQVGENSSETRTTGIGSYSSKDPLARMVARDATTNLRRLVKPFLCTALVGSDSREAALQVAQALSSTISEDLPSESPAIEDGPRASRAEWVELEGREGVAAAQAVAELRLGRQGLETPSLRLDHEPNVLRYLVDARGASSVFRFPVNVRGGIAGIEVRQEPPGYDPGPRIHAVAADRLRMGRFISGGWASLALDDLTRHALICGFTGSGKSNTVLYLLSQLLRTSKNEALGRNGVPFLVLENAKREYRGLLAVEGVRDAGELLVFTPGDDSCSPFRLNPFSLLAGVRVEAHIGRLLDCFLAALPPLPFLPSVLLEALEEAYALRGWMSEHVAMQGDWRTVPTISDLYDSISRIVRERGYSDESEANVRAAIETRIKPLTMGSVGRILNTRHGIEPAVLFGRPVIVELDELRLEDKALLSMFILTLLREYRASEGPCGPGLRHLTVVEEAHQVFARTASSSDGEGSGDARGRAVEAFANMLAEIRAFGESIVIVDQSPEKLSPDAMRNTNLHVVHQLRDARDRDSVARVAIMDDDQRDYVGRMRKPHAAVFYDGLEKAAFVRVPCFVDPNGEARGAENAWCGYREVGAEEVTEYMARTYSVKSGGQESGEGLAMSRPDSSLFRLVHDVLTSMPDLRAALKPLQEDSLQGTDTAVRDLVELCARMGRVACADDWRAAGLECFAQSWRMYRRDLPSSHLVERVCQQLNQGGDDHVGR